MAADLTRFLFPVNEQSPGICSPGRLNTYLFAGTYPSKAPVLPAVPAADVFTKKANVIAGAKWTDENLPIFNSMVWSSRK